MSVTSQPTGMPSSANGRDLDLVHVVLDAADRALCGLYLGHGPITAQYGSASGARCVVCDDLAERFIDGEWHP